MGRPVPGLVEDKQRRMTVALIVNQDEFDEYCQHIRESGIVAFDTEFISEHTYQPQLCLLQFATAERTAAVDPFEVKDLSKWWELMVDDQTTVISHGGQAEIRFCLHYAGAAPRKFVDVQMAEGLRSRSYPLAYATLVNRVIDRRVHGKETRTNWNHRPLSKAQIQYAVEDVKYVLAIWEKQRNSLTRLGRLDWAIAEFDRMVDDIAAEHVREAWHRLPKLHKLSPREMAVVRELSLWREAEAARRDRPPRRILRDDLILELAKRQPVNYDDLFATRDMNRSDLRKSAQEILERIERAVAIPEADLPQPPRPAGLEVDSDEHVVGQLLGIALLNQCSALNVAKTLVGTSADLRDLVRWHQKGGKGTLPRLLHGWRAEVCGDLLRDVLTGKIALRVADSKSDHPLVFERLESAASRSR
jgi:ribonuclease D